MHVVWRDLSSWNDLSFLYWSEMLLIVSFWADFLHLWTIAYGYKEASTLQLGFCRGSGCAFIGVVLPITFLPTVLLWLLSLNKFPYWTKPLREDPFLRYGREHNITGGSSGTFTFISFSVVSWLWSFWLFFAWNYCGPVWKCTSMTCRTKQLNRSTCLPMIHKSREQIDKSWE